jgi:hypothetical protein
MLSVCTLRAIWRKAMNSQFQKLTTWWIVRVSLALLLSGIARGTAPAHQAPSHTATESPIMFMPNSSEISCPKDVHVKDRCILVTGKNFDKRAFWTKFRYTAFLDVPATGVPSGCMGVITTGSLISAQGEVHFKGTGYYCPSSNAAVYHCSFDEAEAQKFGMPLALKINYDGRKERETFNLGD